MINLIKYFTKKHRMTNVLFFGLILMAIFAWQSIGKEEMPEFASNWIRISTVYPGAPAEDVELFITRPMEDELKGVIGIEELHSTSSVGLSSLRIVIDDTYPDKDEVLQEIKDAILRVSLPSEVRELPSIRQFKSSEKAIMDVGFYHKEHKMLDDDSRRELQQYVLSFVNQLTATSEISSIEIDHYKKPELQIYVNTREKKKLELSLSEIANQIKTNNIRVPIGSMNDAFESKVTALNELETPEDLEKLILRGNYEGQGVKLSELATIKNGFESSNSIFKINGHEAVFLNVRKNVSTDILTAQAAVMRFIEKFKRSNKDAPIGIVMMDDESYDVVNRLDIVTKNGLMGFILIIIVLLIFLNVKAGFWVAMGIPFSAAFTVIIAGLAGYTVNNMTLAGVIIVLGIVVDDAIIIAENISRHMEKGLTPLEAAIVGTTEVFRPILASIITTCVAFIPLIYFEGFFGKLVSYIPLIVILMLTGSLLESLFILPSHMSGKTWILDRFNRKNEGHWFHQVEEKYERFLIRLFHIRIPVLFIFLAVLGSAFIIYQQKMNFVMFPREESKEVFIKIKAEKDFIRKETALAIQPIEEMILKDTANIVAVRSSVGLSRRGGEVKENEASILVELIPADDRPTPLNKLLEEWEEKSKNLAGLEEVKFLRGRWGHSSGSAIELQVQENNDNDRALIVKELEEKMKKMPTVSDVEVEEPIVKKEYLFNLKQNKMIQYDVLPTTVTATLRSFVEGYILYSINKGEEEVDVRLSVPDEDKQDLNELLNLRVKNNSGELIYLKNIVEIEEVTRPVNINRTDYKRTTVIYGNPTPESGATPLQVAEEMEDNIFPNLLSKFPTAVLKFKGEIEDTRESQGEFRNSIIMVVIVIYMILVVMFDSMTKPLLVLSIVPFGLAGVVFILLLHGMSIYGFFAAIGALGMIGVVINDAIVMIDKIERAFEAHEKRVHSVIAHVASTRLRPIILTTLTTVVGVLPTAYGIAGYDSMLAEMMLTMGWGLLFGTIITLILIPILYSYTKKREA
jgi:multidrug efflux pump subunit AcrB